jgi:hypothetical protein
VPLERLACLDCHGIVEDLPRQWTKEIAGNGGENGEMDAICVTLEWPFTEKLTRNRRVQYATTDGNFEKW